MGPWPPGGGTSAPGSGRGTRGTWKPTLGLVMRSLATTRAGCAELLRLGGAEPEELSRAHARDMWGREAPVLPAGDAALAREADLPEGAPRERGEGRL
jgi:hypothetical protein